MKPASASKNVRSFQLSLLIILFALQAVIGQHPYGHLIEKEKKIPELWLKSYREKGTQKIFSGEELKTIGMPCGGIAAGQLYVRGDGTLAGWWIANNAYNTGYGFDRKAEIS